jgi:hypothetical protein
MHLLFSLPSKLIFCNRHLEIMTACVQGDYVTIDDRSLYDLRYFYVDTEGIGHFTCGIACEVMMSILQDDVVGGMVKSEGADA